MLTARFPNVDYSKRSKGPAVGSDSPAVDAFGRWRISDPHTIFDSKLLGNSGPYTWDDVEVSGSGTSSTYNANQSSVTLAVESQTAGVRVRQTRQHINYQPGKSQLIMISGVLGAGLPGITRRIGYFDDKNGLFFELAGTTLRVVRRSYTAGYTVDIPVSQEVWNVDKLDGTGPSGIDIDVSKIQVFFIDFEALLSGSVRFGLVIDGQMIIVHRLSHANVLTRPYIQSPNQPVRYELINDGTGDAADLVCVCAQSLSAKVGPIHLALRLELIVAPPR